MSHTIKHRQRAQEVIEIVQEIQSRSNPTEALDPADVVNDRSQSRYDGTKHNICYDDLPNFVVVSHAQNLIDVIEAFEVLQEKISSVFVDIKQVYGVFKISNQVRHLNGVRKRQQGRIISDDI